MAIEGLEPSPGAIVPCLVVAGVLAREEPGVREDRVEYLALTSPATLNGTTCIFPTCSGVIDTVSCKIHSDTCGRSLRFGRYSNQKQAAARSTRRL